MVADLYYCCGGKGTKDGLKENTETREDEQLKGEEVSLQGRLKRGGGLWLRR